MKAFVLFVSLTVSLTTAQAQYSDFKRKTKEPQLSPGSAGYRPPIQPQQPAPQPQPAVRPGKLPPAIPPAVTPAPLPSTRPGSGGGLPSQGGHGGRPRPGRYPSVPDQPTPLPGRPAVRPTPLSEPPPVRPGRPVTRPAPLPGDDFLDIRPRPLPQPLPQPIRPGRPGHLWPERPVVKPIPPGINRPPVILPIHRPPRPTPPPQVNNVWVNHTSVWNNWTVRNNVTINNFVVQRPSYWASINGYDHSGHSWQNYGRPDWNDWRRSYWDYRRQRCQELWNSFYWVSGQLFDSYWWSHCSWAGRPVPQTMPPWWWWQPVTWDAILQHVAIPPKASQPVFRDPGVNLIFQNGRVYIDGVDSWPDWKYVQSTRALASVQWPWEPPYEGGRYQWLPLGVWALAPVEQGEASMFFQLSISREGFISGAYTNVLTGEDLRVQGCAHLGDQRVAFFIGDRADTVIETSLAQFTNDVTGAFLHYSNGQSSDWLLTRIPGPGSPPGPVRIPSFPR